VSKYGWKKNLEGEVTTKDIYMIICGFWGVNIENDKEDSFDSFNTTAVVGIRFFDSIYLLLMRELIMNLDREFPSEEV
jgi:hypothetical protein